MRHGPSIRSLVVIFTVDIFHNRTKQPNFRTRRLMEALQPTTAYTKLVLALVPK